MVTERQMKELFARANPIPDVDVVVLDTATHLEELKRRTSEMAQLETPTRPTTGPTSKLRLTLAGGLALALAVVVTLVVLSNSDPEEVAGEGDLVSADFVGTWSVPMEGISALFLYFGEDGRYALSDSFGSFEERTIETGDWAFDGDEFVFTTDDDVASSCAGTVGSYTVRRVDEERIRLTAATPDPCSERQQGIALGALRAYPLDPEFSDG